MSLPAQCPQCAQLLSFPEGSAGMDFQCTRCQSVVNVLHTTEKGTILQLASAPTAPVPVLSPAGTQYDPRSSTIQSSLTGIGRTPIPDRRRDALQKRVKTGWQTLALVGILHCAFGVIQIQAGELGGDASRSLDPGANLFVGGFMIAIGIGALALWNWAKTNPVPALKTGFVVLLGLMVLGTASNPEVAAKGWFLNGLILIALYRGYSAASELNEPEDSSALCEDPRLA